MSRELAVRRLKDDLKECDFHIAGLETVIKSERLDHKPATDLLSTLEYALAAMKQKRLNIKHVIGRIDVN